VGSSSVMLTPRGALRSSSMTENAATLFKNVWWSPPSVAMWMRLHSDAAMDAAVHDALKERGVLVTHVWLDALSAARPALLALPAAQQVRSRRLDPRGVGTTLEGRRNEPVVARGRPCLSSRFAPITPRTAPAFAVSRTCRSLVRRRQLQV